VSHDDALDTRGGAASVAEVERGHWEPPMSVVGPVVREAGVQWGHRKISRDSKGHSRALGIASAAKAAENQTSNEGM